MFWSAKPTMDTISGFFDELDSRAHQLDEVLDKWETFNYYDALWIAQRTYKMGAYLTKCAADARAVEDPIDPAKSQELIDKVTRMKPITMSALDKGKRAKPRFEKLMVTPIARIQMQWLANCEHEFAQALVERSPNEDIRKQSDALAKEFDDAFDEALKVYGIGRESTGESANPLKLAAQLGKGDKSKDAAATADAEKPPATTTPATTTTTTTTTETPAAAAPAATTPAPAATA